MGPHDAFFKVLMELPDVAAALLWERLPEGVRELLSRAPPEEVLGTFIDEELRTSQSDKLFRVRTRAGEPAYVYCLVEHKSTQERALALQLLRYKVRIWERLGVPGEGVAPIFCLVVYNGRERWTGPTRFAGSYRVAERVLPLLLDFPFAVLDLGAVADAQLSQHAMLRGGLRALKYATRVDEQRAMLEPVLRGFLGPDGLPRPQVVAYVLYTYMSVDREHLRHTLGTLAVEWDEAQLSKAAREFLEEGRVEGRVAGRVEGRVEGQVTALRETLQQLLRFRFGELPNTASARLASADLPTLTRWRDRAFTASSLDTVFEDS